MHAIVEIRCYIQTAGVSAEIASHNRVFRHIYKGVNTIHTQYDVLQL